MRTAGSKNIIKAFKEQWKNSDRHQKMNLRRVAVDLGVITFLGIIGLIISGYADDEDERDNYLLQGLAYFYTRLMNEMSSVQQVGSVTSINEALESPIIGLNIIQGLTDVTDVFNSDIVQNGFYAGYTKRRRYLSKMLPLVSQINYFESSDNIYRTRKMYEHFNRSNLKATPLAFIESRLEADE